MTTTLIDRQKAKIVVTRDLGSEVMPLLFSRTDVELVLWREDRVADRSWLLNCVRGAKGLLVMLNDRVDEELLVAAGPSLEVVSTMSVGYDHVDVSELARRGVNLGYTPDVLTSAAADLSIMLALMAGRNAGEIIDVVKGNKWPTKSWQPFGFCGQQLSRTFTAQERTVGFLGFGRIAQATLARLVPFGITHCIYSSRPSSLEKPDNDEHLAKKLNLVAVRRVELDQLARESDVLFILAPGGAATHHVIGEDFLKQMKQTSVLVNTSRGTLVDSLALAKALREKWIWGAGLDVVEGEPNIRNDHPLVKEPRCVVLPHVGSATFETRLGMATLAVRNLLSGVDGETMPAQLDLKGTCNLNWRG